MNYRYFLSILSVTLCITFASFGKDRASKHTTVKGDLVSITYGQPSMKGRTIFGELVPYGEVWRTGADEATEITFSSDCIFAGKQCKAGTYTLFTIPGKNKWDVILNAELKQWGAFNYDKIKNKNVLDVQLDITPLSNAVETFTIDVAKENITMKWEKTSIVIPVKSLR